MEARSQYSTLPSETRPIGGELAKQVILLLLSLEECRQGSSDAASTGFLSLNTDSRPISSQSLETPSKLHYKCIDQLQHPKCL